MMGPRHLILKFEITLAYTLNHIVEYNLTSPYDIDTATKVNEKNFDRVIDFAFNQDGTKFFYLSGGWHNNATSPHASRLFNMI